MLFGEHAFVFTFLLTENLREILEVTISFLLTDYISGCYVLSIRRATHFLKERFAFSSGLSSRAVSAFAVGVHIASGFIWAGQWIV